MPEPDLTAVDTSQIDRDDLQLITEAACEAGRITLKYFGRDPEVWMKEGDSPVSEADHAADQFLHDALLKARPDYGWLSEETTDNLERLDFKRVFIVDPIDGTRGFIHGHAKWCVSIAVVDQGRPACGVLECPAMEETFSAVRGGGGWLNGKRIVKNKANNPLRFAGPKKLVEKLAAKAQVDFELAPFIPSLAYRLAMVATGTLDGAYARADSHDWDIAATQLIIEESGAKLSKLDGAQIIYNRRDIRHGILVAASDKLHGAMLGLETK